MSVEVSFQKENRPGCWLVFSHWHIQSTEHSTYKKISTKIHNSYIFHYKEVKRYKATRLKARFNAFESSTIRSRK